MQVDRAREAAERLAVGSYTRNSLGTKAIVAEVIRAAIAAETNELREQLRECREAVEKELLQNDSDIKHSESGVYVDPRITQENLIAHHRAMRRTLRRIAAAAKVEVDANL